MSHFTNIKTRFQNLCFRNRSVTVTWLSILFSSGFNAFVILDSNFYPPIPENQIIESV
jgi:hypothetical protein